MSGPAAPPGRRRVAILGGGIAGLAAAHELVTRHPDAYDVTIYTQGWRLGGKCATGREPAPPYRIEEHGIHVLFGCYEHAFELLRETYAGLARPPGDPLREWTDAFRARDDFQLMQERGGAFEPWRFRIPRGGGTPGDRARVASAAALDVDRFLGQLWAFVQTEFEALEASLGPAALLIAPLRIFFRAIEEALEALGVIPEDEPAIQRTKPAVDRATRPDDSFFGTLRGLYSDSVAGVRRAWILLELAAAVALGLKAAIEDPTKQRFSDLDDEEFTAWLDRHALGPGLSDRTRHSAPLAMIYHIVFSFEDGDASRPNIGAGSALRGAMRLLLDSPAALWYEMQAGAGEAIVTPLYELLERRGVRFEFFHRVTGLALSASGDRLAAIELDVQATPVGGRYDPILRVGGVGCWPSVPRYERLVEGARLAAGSELPGGGYDLESPWSDWRPVAKRALRLGDDFDVAILAIPVGGLAEISAEITTHAAPAVRTRWKRMLAGLRTVPTQMIQLWLAEDADGLGETLDPGDRALLGTFAAPLANYVDVTHLVAREAWPAPRPRHAAQLCGPLSRPATPPNAGLPAAAHRAVREAGLDFLQAHGRALWPKAFDASGLRHALFVDPGGGAGVARYRAQIHRANVKPWEGYVASFRGSWADRIAPGDSGLPDLFLAGDWTRNGFDVGCVEATVLSARQAVRALTGGTAPLYGEDDPIPTRAPKR